MDRNNLQQVNQLYGQLSALDAAERAFDNGGVIVAMEVSPGPVPESTPDNPQPAPFGIRVPTHDMQHPQQMIDGIKQQFTQRRQHIQGELKKLGMTGVEQQAAKK